MIAASDARVRVDHFSDTLCVWAYVSQVRLDELLNRLGERIEIEYHFINMFGNTRTRIREGWQARGGYEGFAAHVQEVGKAFPHVCLHTGLWREVTPPSSAPSHHFLKAIQLLETRGEIDAAPRSDLAGRALAVEAIWRVRDAFFREGKDISRLTVLLGVAEDLGLPVARLEELLTGGEAMAELCSDLELRDSHRLEGSPTYMLNGGRQKLYGNVGYRVIEANVLELLQRPEGTASWC